MIDEQYAINSGPTSVINHQPLDGKAVNGGIRVGEMEKDVYVAHGTGRALHEKFYANSDSVDIHICRCGNRAVVNEKLGIYKCKICEDKADIVRVPSCWAANTFINEVNAMNINTNFGISPHIFPKQQDI